MAQQELGRRLGTAQIDGGWIDKTTGLPHRFSQDPSEGIIIPPRDPKTRSRIVGREISQKRRRSGDLRPLAPIENHGDMEWGVESLGPDIEHPAEELTPDQFQHLAIEDQVERMWDVYEAEGIVVDLQVPARKASIAVQNIPGLDISKSFTEKDRRAIEMHREFKGDRSRKLALEGSRNIDVRISEDVDAVDIPGVSAGTYSRAWDRMDELGLGLTTTYTIKRTAPVITRRKDQDPDRGVHRELVGVTDKWGRSEEVERPWVGNRERVSAREHIEEGIGDYEVASTFDAVYQAEENRQTAEEREIIIGHGKGHGENS